MICHDHHRRHDHHQQQHRYHQSASLAFSVMTCSGFRFAGLRSWHWPIRFKKTLDGVKPALHTATISNERGDFPNGKHQTVYASKLYTYTRVPNGHGCILASSQAVLHVVCNGTIEWSAEGRPGMGTKPEGSRRGAERVCFRASVASDSSLDWAGCVEWRGDILGCSGSGVEPEIDACNHLTICS